MKKLLLLFIFATSIAFSQTTTTTVGTLKLNNKPAVAIGNTKQLVRNPITKRVEEQVISNANPFTTNQTNAITGANAPSGSNVFATMLDLPTQSLGLINTTTGNNTDNSIIIYNNNNLPDIYFTQLTPGGYYTDNYVFVINSRAVSSISDGSLNLQVQEGNSIPTNYSRFNIIADNFNSFPSLQFSKQYNNNKLFSNGIYFENYKDIELEGSRNYTFRNMPPGDYNVALTIDLYKKITIGVNNPTTTVLTSTQLNSQYPTATTGFKIYCTSIIAGSMVYERTPTQWIGMTVIVP